MATQKEQIWIAEYFKCWNATEAARRAGYRWPDKQGQEKKAKFAEEIRGQLDKVKMSADEVLRRLSEHARADIGQYIEVLPGGQAIIDLEKAKESNALHLIKKLKVTKTGPEIELYDQQTALLNIGKQHGLFSDRHIVEVRLEKEIDAILDVIEGLLSREDYERVLSALSANPESGEAAQR